MGNNNSNTSAPESGENIYEEVGQPPSCSTDSSIYSTSNSKKQTFSLIREEKSHERHQRFNVFMKFVKLFAYVLAFSFILLSSIVSKSTIILMCSMISVNTTNIINENDSTHSQTRNTTSVQNGINGTFVATDVRRTQWLWSLFFAVIFPEILTFFRSAGLCTFKYNFCIPMFITIITKFTIETLNSIGVGLLVFLIMPTMDSLNCILITSSLCFVPAMLILLSNRETKSTNRKLMDTLSFVIQIIAIIIWPIIVFVEGSNRYLSLPIALILISMKWFENFHELKYDSIYITKIIEVMRELKSVKVRYTLHTFISLWKIAVTFATMIIIELSLNGSETVNYIFSNLFEGFDDNDNPNESKISILWLLIFQISSSYLCYVSSKLCCNIGMNYSFSLANNLTFPLTLIFIIIMNETNKLSLLFPTLHNADWYFTHKDTNDAIIYIVIILSILTLASQLWTTNYIWSSKRNKLNTTEKNFIDPMYSSVFIDQSLALNRRRKDKFKIKNSEQQENIYFNESEFYLSPDNDWGCQPIEFNKLINIIACVTLWHEESKEMMQMIESIMRLDCDQLVKQLWPLMSKCFDKLQPYKLEVNIFLDDAFETKTNSNGEEVRVINKYVKRLLKTVEEAAARVYKFNLKMKPMRKLDTPYGGRLEWLMPGETKFMVHLKNCKLIRNKKRWSQIMYMSFLLEHRMKNMNYENGNLNINDIKENTFILALDGDISFRPQALELLIKTIKKCKTYGAVCGRIHPNKASGGAIAWYQKFDYANSHWLQKSSEHVFGSVLCSPGCFSLYRAQALLDVMEDYSQETTTGLHELQRDMGEDRWLCTLFLMKDWRIEYCSASEAYTFVPETFIDFLVQQLRWKVSTVLNILELLHTRFKKQYLYKMENITFAYGFYQIILAISTLLTPGTTFLMIVSAMHIVMRLSVTIWFIVNTVIFSGYSILCYYTSDQKMYLKVIATKIFSTIYGLIMLAVILDPLIELKSMGLNLITVFFLGIMLTQVIAAILHPQELKCILPLGFYFFIIPYTFLILPIYALTHLHNAKWGTREDNYSTGELTKDEESRTENRSEFSLINWKDDSNLKKFNCSTVSENEAKFWSEKLEEKLSCKYSKKFEKGIEKSLLKLKDHSLLIIGCINVAFLLLIYILQLYFSFSVGVFRFDPIGIVLVAFFGSIIVIQFIGMLVHRFSTLLMLLAVTEIDFFEKKKQFNSDEEYIYAIDTINKKLDKEFSEFDFVSKATPPEMTNLKQLIKRKLNETPANRLQHRRSSAFEPSGLSTIPDTLVSKRFSDKAVQILENDKKRDFLHRIIEETQPTFYELPNKIVMIGQPFIKHSET